jgi:L-lactate dehydrogenase complex protein LldG
VKGARSEILGRVRAAGARAQLPRIEVAPRAAAEPRLAQAALAARFSQEARGVDCQVHGPVAGPEALEVVLSILRELHAHQLVVWGATELPVPGIGDALIERGFHFLDDVLPADRTGRAAQLAKLDPADVGLTGALAGLADTGSLVMASGSGRPRLSWLLPPVHVALLPLHRLYASLEDFLAEAGERVQQSANIALVTGPSRSGDIEMVLTRGVHGPGVLHVVLLG